MKSYKNKCVGIQFLWQLQFFNQTLSGMHLQFMFGKFAYVTSGIDYCIIYRSAAIAINVTTEEIPAIHAKHSPDIIFAHNCTAYPIWVGGSESEDGIWGNQGRV